MRTHKNTHKTMPRPNDRVQDNVAEFRHELAQREAGWQASRADYLLPQPAKKQRSIWPLVVLLVISLIVILIAQ
jgi:hypothetical protein